ncbi:DNA repair exonuclease [Rhizobium sp. S96]|uniref:metallophosphoesterase family protein n=1 Tax=Rhizobium sp. S96 TaxID=3055140 RepID=UPI0025AAA63C|nr:DNA repair exonuclease [Rhizobium sp. S96]MDM9624101.1 DNA repair exonuclease [Rhizobium sp. S96]
MSSFRFIHAADLHLGSPFQGLALKDPDIAAIFVEASRKAFSTLVSRAIELDVDFFVIAGDVYDGDWKDNKIGLFFSREMGRLDRAGIPVYLLRGNHDALSIITKTISLPGNVYEFSTSKPETMLIESLNVALHGQGFAERSANDNLALTYPPAVRGWFNIGVLHTSLGGKEPHAPYAPCSLEDLRSRGYDYWALGHVHEFEEVASDPVVVFPGNLQGRSVRERGAKGAVLVTVDDSRIELERMIVDEARFAVTEIGIDLDQSAPDILRLVEQSARAIRADADERITALRVRLRGASRLHRNFTANRQQWIDEVQAACHRAHEDIWLEKLELLVIEPPIRAPSDGAILDLGRLVAEHGNEDDLQSEAAILLSSIVPRLPGGIGASDLPLEMTVDALIEEARQLLLARGEGDA